MLINKFIAVFLLLLFPFAGNKPENPFTIIKDNSPVVAYQMLIDKNSQGDFQTQESFYSQALGTLYSFTGRYVDAKKCFAKDDSIRHQNKGIKFENLQINKTLNADSAIVQLAKEFHVIAFNEEHHVPMSRAIVSHYLKPLAKLGYKYLALEALDERDSLIYKRGYPLHYKTGYYTDEPIFGLLIRQALKLGYTLIPYESESGDREKMQAKNIIKQYDPKKGKLVILAGYGHIIESENRSMMGYFLKSALNEDILTIKLTGSSDYTNQIDTSFNQPQLIPYKPEIGYDYQYLIPPAYRTNAVNNIPAWYVPFWGNTLWEIDLIKEFPDSYIYFTPPYLIRLTKASEKDGVPIYQYLETGKRQQKITLPFHEPDAYELTIQMNNKEFTKEIRR